MSKTNKQTKTLSGTIKTDHLGSMFEKGCKKRNIPVGYVAALPPRDEIEYYTNCDQADFRVKSKFLSFFYLCFKVIYEPSKAILLITCEFLLCAFFWGGNPTEGPFQRMRWTLRFFFFICKFSGSDKGGIKWHRRVVHTQSLLHLLTG